MLALAMITDRALLVDWYGGLVPSRAAVAHKYEGAQQGLRIIFRAYLYECLERCRINISGRYRSLRAEVFPCRRSGLPDPYTNTWCFALTPARCFLEMFSSCVSSSSPFYAAFLLLFSSFASIDPWHCFPLCAQQVSGQQGFALNEVKLLYSTVV